MPDFLIIMELIEIGIVLKPQGIKGELKIQPKTDDLKRFKALKYLIVNGEERKVLTSRVDGSAAYLLLDGIFTRNQAEQYRNLSVFVKRSDALKLPPDRYFIDDVIGCMVCGEKQDYGNVVEIMKNKIDRDVYVIQKDGKRVMIPAIKSLIKEFDLDNKKIIIDDKIFNEVAVDEV